MSSHLHHHYLRRRYHLTCHRVSHPSVLCQQVKHYRTTGLHTVLTTELLCSDISFGWILFQKDTTLAHQVGSGGTLMECKEAVSAEEKYHIAQDQQIPLYHRDWL